MAKSKPVESVTVATSVAPSASYTVVARRYRPQQLVELIGQEHVAQALTNALNSGRVAHAYLFTGARGVGKTSCARILAKAMNCVKGPTPTPCDVCDICKSIATGDDVDVLEIDGASNNKVDEIRDLRSNVGFRPTRARFKIYIIDEVHMLTTGAFNALLKTLEEPPPHVKFIFATTEIHKIPITILSRCQRFDFAQVRTQKIFEALQKIVAKEGLKADDESLHMIARRAAGSMRDSQSLLDQLLAFSDGDLTSEKVHSLFGTAGEDRVTELAEAILTGDSPKALSNITDFAERGLQLGELLDQLIEYWRGLMLVLSAGNDFSELPGTPAYREKLKRHAKGTNLDTILAGLDIWTTTKMKMRGSSFTQILLEMAVIRLSRLEDLVTLSQLTTLIASGGTAAPAPRPVAATKPVPASPNPTPTVEASKKKPIAVPETDGVPFPVIDASNLAEVWPMILQEMGSMKARSLVLAKNVAISGPNALVIPFPPDYSSAYQNVSGENTNDELRKVLKRLTGQDWAIRIELLVGLPSATRDVPKATPSTRAKDIKDLPMFKAAFDVLGAQFVNIENGYNPHTPIVADDWQEPLPEPLTVLDEDELE